MKRTIAALLTGAAGLAALAIALPGTASADTATCNPQARAAAHAQARPQISAYLSAHPDLATEVAHIKTLPKGTGQHKAEWQSYRQAHPDETAGLRAAAQPIVAYRQACHR